MVGICNPTWDSTDFWTWNIDDKSCEVKLIGNKNRTALFHPKWSNGTAAVRATSPLSSGITYWEIRISRRIFGTSLMFGVTTDNARLHANAFVNLIGEDEHGWGLSHKGYIWHNGKSQAYTKPFPENQSTTVGILYNSNLGTLCFFKDGESLGVAFTGLNQIQQPLYPAISSTAARTEMTLLSVHRQSINLQAQCRSVILRQADYNGEAIDNLPLPRKIQRYLKEPILLHIEDKCCIEQKTNSSLNF